MMPVLLSIKSHVIQAAIIDWEVSDLSVLLNLPAALEQQKRSCVALFPKKMFSSKYKIYRFSRISCTTIMKTMVAFVDTKETRRHLSRMPTACLSDSTNGIVN